MNNIQKMRIASGRTQEQVAELLNVDRSTVAKWETGVSFPRSSILADVAQLYGCSLADLFSFEGDKPKPS